MSDDPTEIIILGNLGMGKTEPRVLARYDGNSPGNRAFKAARDNAPGEVKFAYLGRLRMALHMTDERYAESLATFNLLGAEADDLTRLLLRREISEVREQLGLPRLP